MDYILAIVFSVLTPFVLENSNIDYSTGLFVDVSNNNINSYGAKSIKSDSKNQFDILNVEHSGTYNNVYGVGVNYKFYNFFEDSYKKNIWFRPKIGYHPLREMIDVQMLSQISVNPVVKRYHYAEHPYFGLDIGYDLYTFHKGELLASYAGVNFMRVGYEGESGLFSLEQYDSVAQFVLGLEYIMDYKWSIYSELTYMNMELKAIPDQGQDIRLIQQRLQFGFAYHLYNSDIDIVDKKNREENYSNLIEEIDPNISIKQYYQKKREREKILNEKAKLYEQKGNKNAPLLKAPNVKNENKKPNEPNEKSKENTDSALKLPMKPPVDEDTVNQQSLEEQLPENNQPIIQEESELSISE